MNHNERLHGGVVTMLILINRQCNSISYLEQHALGLLTD